MATSNPNTVAANLAVLLHQARHQPDAVDALSEAARVLHLALGGEEFSALTVRGRLEINGRKLSESAPGVRDVNEHLLIHGVRHLVVPVSAGPEDLLTLARVLSAYPGVYADWETMLAALGPTRGRIQVAGAGEDMPLLHYSDQEAGPLIGGESAASGVEFLDPLAQDMTLTVPPVEPPDAYEAGPRPAGRTYVDHKEDARRLQELVQAGRSADDAGDMIALLDVARGFLDAADAAAVESSARLYRIELSRMMSRRHLAQFAKLAAIGKHREVAVDVLRRLGAEATEVLMELLVESDSMPERRGLFTAITRMAEGTDIIAHHLDHPAWYVVRNAAELCGELQLAESVPSLSKAARHPDERVRKSVATALIKIGAREGLEALARMLKDPSPAIRLQVLGSLDGHWGRPLAMSLAALL
ncbi:MAG: hypothetical protein H6R40_869, partial [Gemmatimonadetes bacterium]|nr:hypothetical protein [Gemmatimonadota bacterium]